MFLNENACEAPTKENVEPSPMQYQASPNGSARDVRNTPPTTLAVPPSCPAPVVTNCMCPSEPRSQCQSPGKLPPPFGEYGPIGATSSPPSGAECPSLPPGHVP